MAEADPLARDATDAARRMATATMRVHVADLHLSALIGINPDELDRRQPLIVGIELTLAAAHIDDLAESVDYCRIAAEAEALAAEHITLIEIFAYRLAERCLAMGAVLDVGVSVVKPQALARGTASVSIRMTAP